MHDSSASISGSISEMAAGINVKSDEFLNVRPDAIDFMCNPVTTRTFHKAIIKD